MIPIYESRFIPCKITRNKTNFIFEVDGAKLVLSYTEVMSYLARTAKFNDKNDPLEQYFLSRLGDKVLVLKCCSLLRIHLNNYLLGEGR